MHLQPLKKVLMRNHQREESFAIKEFCSPVLVISLCNDYCVTVCNTTENGCWKCLQPSQTVKTSVRRHSRAFLYQNGNPKEPLRTAENVKENAVEAT